METEIQEFYRDKNIFITGGTGFLGKVIIEKLLRTTQLQCIYLLIRPKRGQDIQERLTLWKKDVVFETLLKSKSKALDRVVPIVGDCLDPSLGLSQSDRQLLQERVHIVLHGAATVRFNEPLHVALAINTRATRLLVQLAKQMQRLESFVHISTAFSNCVVQHIKECFYADQLTCSVDKVLELEETLSNDMLDNMAPTLLDKFPNTYTYTKALAEQVLQKEAGDLPYCIFRPGIIIASHREPLAGWIDNLYGPIGIIYGVGYGVLRLTLLDVKAQASLVPVDYCANLALASAWQTAKKVSLSPLIYNFTPNEENLLTYGDFRDKALVHGRKLPVTRMIWYPFMHTTAIPWLFHLAAFFYHTVPGHVFDFGLRLLGKKPRLVNIYQKIHKSCMLLKPFSTKSWRFDMHNTELLWKSMSSLDRQIYYFDMADLDWDEYFVHALRGMRHYIGKEDPTAESISKGHRLQRRLFLLHYLLMFSLTCAALAFLWLMLERVICLF